MNRKWLWAVAIGVLLAASGVWYFGWRPGATVEKRVETGRRDFVVAPRNDPRNNGDAEPSEPVIEPLVVENRWTEPATPSVVPEAPAPVYLTPDTKQGPRPDAEQARPRRMPYADEPLALFSWPFDPLTWILESIPLSQLKLFDNLPGPDAAEESEPKTPTAEPMPPMGDYHHHPGHCPYLSGEYPYRR